MPDDPDGPSRPQPRPRRPAASGRGRLAVDVVATSGARPAAAAGLEAWLARVAVGRVAGAVTVALVSDARIRALNRRYRRIDRVTDVLSFPAFTPSALRRAKPASSSSPPASGPRPPASDPRFLGDIVIATGRARRQARAAGHRLAEELRLLALHGLLHLAGFDHERDAGRMGRLERALRRKGGLETGLIERARRGAPAWAARRER